MDLGEQSAEHAVRTTGAMHVAERLHLEARRARPPHQRQQFQRVLQARGWDADPIAILYSPASFRMQWMQDQRARGEAWTQLWPGASLGGYAFIGGVAVLGAAMQGPLAAVVLLAFALALYLRPPA